MGRRYRNVFNVKEIEGIIESWLGSKSYDSPTNAFAAMLAHVITVCTGMPCACTMRDNTFIPEGHCVFHGENVSPAVVFTGEIDHPDDGLLLFYLNGDKCTNAWYPLSNAGGVENTALAKKITPLVAELLSHVDLVPKINIDFDGHFQLADLLPFVSPSKVIAYAISLDGGIDENLDSWIYKYYCQYLGLLEAPASAPEYLVSGYSGDAYCLSDLQYPFDKRGLDTLFIESERFPLLANALVPNCDLEALGAEWLIANVVRDLGWANTWAPGDSRAVTIPPEIYQNVRDIAFCMSDEHRKELYRGCDESTHLDAMIADLSAASLRCCAPSSFGTHDSVK